MTVASTLRPDSRGRIALGPLIDGTRTYTAHRDDDGTIVLTPVAHLLTDQQYEDLQADPEGFARLLDRARALEAGEVETIPVSSLFGDSAG